MTHRLILRIGYGTFHGTTHVPVSERSIPFLLHFDTRKGLYVIGYCICMLACRLEIIEARRRTPRPSQTRSSTADYRVLSAVGVHPVLVERWKHGSRGEK